MTQNQDMRGLNPENLISDIRDLLHDNGIDTTQWSGGKTKTLEHLAGEIAVGETELTETYGGLRRNISVLAISVLHIDQEYQLWKLFEDRQEMSDGSGTRFRKISSSISEKLMAHEIPGAAAVQRALQEELGLTLDLVDLPDAFDERLEEAESESYPGLITRYTLHKCLVVIGAEQFDPDGYTEKQPDKTTYFEWRNIIVP